MELAFKRATSARYQTRFRLLTLLGILVGFSLRLYRLGAESLWYDETVSVALAQKSMPALIRHTAGDIHPPGYYLLLHFWQTLTHPTPALGLEFLYAWPSLCCGLGVMVLLFALGRTLATPQVAVLALWLAAINPYHIWYSQEVRMYTLGALAGLLGLWALLQWWQPPAGRAAPRTHWLVVYTVAGAIGLYSLYYFLFVLFALNSIALWLWLRQRSQTAGRMVSAWLSAQVAILLLWLPWLPVFWRQISDPPVPPWRTPWQTGAQFRAAMAESASALLNGQSAPAPTAWFWLLIFCLVLIIAYLGYTNRQKDVAAPYQPQPRSPQAGYFILVAYVLIPLITMTAITLWVTPLYHVRYLFTYAPPMLLLLAAALVYGARRQRGLGVLGVAAILLLNGWSLYRFWFTPAFQADDHRSAVAQVAKAWRPGDVILVNAGWIYTALTTYWPTALAGVDAANPPPLHHLIRLIDYPALQQQQPQESAPLLASPTVVRTGTIDGAPSLGWGEPSSDFFAMSTTTATDALSTLTQNYSRLWHYRLYDTVNDPQGFIRTWLDANNTLVAESPVPGRDYLRLELYQNVQTPIASVAWTSLPLPPVRFTGDLQLAQVALAAPTVTAGAYLYTQLVWRPPVDRTKLPAVVSFSLRLYTDDGHLLAQADETPPRSVQAWPNTYGYTMALPIPVATPPGAHKLVLIAYDQQSGAPLAVQGTAPPRQELLLAPVQVEPATQAPVITDVQASFDYIDLVRARLPAATAGAGSTLEVELVWRPRPNAYRDTYLAQLTLQDTAGSVVGQSIDALGSWHYSSGTWPPLIPVRDWRFLAIEPTTLPGQYTLVLRVLRDGDKQLIPARQTWWAGKQDAFVIGTVEIR